MSNIEIILIKHVSMISSFNLMQKIHCELQNIYEESGENKQNNKI